MADEGYRRKLTAILGADVKGYSSLMDDNEEATLRTLTLYRKAFVDLIEQFRGRVVSTPGDYILAEFGSVVDSVNCAVEVQRELAERNTKLPDKRKMEFRIGINLGDVIEEDGQIYGDGVNIAARMEPLADPGGICISGRVYDQISNKLELGYEYLGDHKVKNISTPIRVYKVHPSVDQIKFGSRITNIAIARKWSRATLFTLCILLFGIIGAVMWSLYYRTSNFESPANEMAFFRAEKPSIAVLAFDNLNNRPKEDYFSDGISESIITRLARLSNIHVIARNSSFVYKGKAINLKQVGKELGAGYVVEGSVQKVGDRIRITAQLIETSTGKHLWADKYDRRTSNLFELQDDITLNVVLEVLQGMEAKLTPEQVESLKYNETENVEAWSIYAKGLSNYRRTNAFNNAQAQKFFRQSVALDPGFEAAKLGIAWTYYAQARWHWATGIYPYDKRKEFLATAIELTRQVMEQNEALAEPLALLAQIKMIEGDYDKAIAFGQQAVARNPNNTEFHLILADIFSFAGNPEQAIAEWNKAILLNPFPSDEFQFVYGRILYQLERYDDAIRILDRLVEQNPDIFQGRERLNLISVTLLIASYSAAGYSEARNLAVKYPHSYKTILDKFFLFKNQSDTDRIIQDLNRVGLIH